MRCKRETMLLYAVTDRSWTGRQTLPEQVEAALKGGATCIQLREKDLDEAAFFEEALAVKQLCQAYHVPLIINDNVELAVRCGADGVHVGQSDMEASNVRARVGENMIVGVSARTVEEAAAAEQAGADYLGVGAVFATSTKTDALPVSHETLKEICAAVRIPVVAIGGISQKNLPLLAGTGIAGIAVVSAVFAADDIEKACVQLKKAAEEAVQA